MKYKNHLKFCYTLLFLVALISCAKDKVNNDEVPDSNAFISSVDLSSLPEIEAANTIFYNLNNQEEDVLTTLKNNGVNTIRLRIWHNPATSHSAMEEVKALAQKVKLKDLKVWLTVHYSDFWADPEQQQTPSAWTGEGYSVIKNNVYNYTKDIMLEIEPDYIQIGNEINSGFLFPYGAINNEDQFIALLSTGVEAVRENSATTKVIMHFAGLEGSDWFFDKIKTVDYDIIGLSYYPIWHGKNLNTLKSTITNLSTTYNKDILIAETAYPFSLQWNDLTNNIVGLDEHLILPQYPATPQGQRNYLKKIKEIILSTNKGVGFCYWEGAYVAFNGINSENGSSWENQTLYNFENQALPILNEFNNN